MKLNNEGILTSPQANRAMCDSELDVKALKPRVERPLVILSASSSSEATCLTSIMYTIVENHVTNKMLINLDMLRMLIHNKICCNISGTDVIT